ncbi:MAG: hypothetical protein U0798_21185 [Gemmataceae bacterium]
MLTVDDLKPDANGKPTNTEAVSRIKRDADGKPMYASSTWPNTGIGRLNLDGSPAPARPATRGILPAASRQPENCGKCHLGPDHPRRKSTRNRSTASPTATCTTR